ncbi:MAG: hypothetical protein E2600_15225 [Chryseobacterium sp.]|nr:hypothetical protein [Chryseobacterium sp.]
MSKLLILLSSVYCFVACKRDESEIKQSEIIGTWTIIKIKFEIEDAWAPFPENPTHKLKENFDWEIGFKTDGQIITGPAGTWKPNDSNNGFTLYKKDNLAYGYYTVLESNGNTMTLECRDDGIYKHYEIWERQ